MILYTENLKLEDADNEKLWSTIDRPQNHFTTSYGKNDKDLTFLIPFYQKIICAGMSQYGLESRTNYNFNIWYQCYNKTSDTHGVHDHYSGDEIFSWVHIISAANDKCFYYIVDGEKIYPEQSDGQFLMFPSWLLHGVKPVETDGDRLIIAGNICLTYYKGTGVDLHFSKSPEYRIVSLIKEECDR